MVRRERAGVAEECCLLTLSEAKGGHANSVASSAVHSSSSLRRGETRFGTGVADSAIDETCYRQVYSIEGQDGYGAEDHDSTRSAGEDVLGGHPRREGSTR